MEEELKKLKDEDQDFQRRLDKVDAILTNGESPLSPRGMSPEDKELAKKIKDKIKELGDLRQDVANRDENVD